MAAPTCFGTPNPKYSGIFSQVFSKRSSHAHSRR
jgi:hypothetical protein